MDQRIKKTKQSIYNAFIELRTKKPLEKLTVKEICETAQINKSTFYVYYHDVYDLSDKIENDIISEVVKKLDNTKEILTDPAGFCRQLFLAYKTQHSLINTVFTGVRAEQLPRKIETVLKETIFAYYPQYKDDVDLNIKLTYSIYGGFYAYKEYSNYDSNHVNNIISEFSEKIMG